MVKANYTGWCRGTFHFWNARSAPCTQSVMPEKKEIETRSMNVFSRIQYVASIRSGMLASVHSFWSGFLKTICMCRRYVSYALSLVYIFMMLSQHNLPSRDGLKISKRPLQCLKRSHRVIWRWWGCSKNEVVCVMRFWPVLHVREENMLNHWKFFGNPSTEWWVTCVLAPINS